MVLVPPQKLPEGCQRVFRPLGVDRGGSYKKTAQNLSKMAKMGDFKGKYQIKIQFLVFFAKKM